MGGESYDSKKKGMRELIRIVKAEGKRMRLQEVLALSAVSFAITEPPLVVLERSDLLTVVVRHRVSKSLLARVGSHLLYMSKKLSVLDIELGKLLTKRSTEDNVAKRGSEESADTSEKSNHYGEHLQRVKTENELRRVNFNISNGGPTSSDTEKASEDGGADIDATAAEALGKELVPGELVLSRGAGRGGIEANRSERRTKQRSSRGCEEERHEDDV